MTHPAEALSLDFGSVVTLTMFETHRFAYQSCLDSLGLKAEQCVFIDNQMRNVKGGLNVGMRAIYLDVQDPRAAFNAALSEMGIAKSFTAPGTLVSN